MTTVWLSRRLAILWVITALALGPISCASARRQVTEPAPTQAAAQPTSEPASADVPETSMPARDTTGRASVEAITPGSTDTLLVRSFPTGLNVYVIPRSKLRGHMAIFEYTDEENLVGQTPLELKLAPDAYAISIEIEPHGDFHKDGEDGQIIEITPATIPDKDGYLRSVGTRAKFYNVEKQTGHQMLVTALFWPKDQSLVAFVHALPASAEFEQLPAEELELILKKYGVPPAEWSLLQTMLNVTGKAVWYGDAPEQTLVMTWSETAPERKLDFGPIKQLE